MITKFRLLLQKLRPAHVLSVLFLGYVLWVSLGALPEFLYHFGSAFHWETGYKHFVETVDQQYEGMLAADNSQPFLRNKGTYINFNGLLARVLGQPMTNDRILLKNGHLSHVVSQQPDPEEIRNTAQNIARFYDLQTASGGNFLFVLSPVQISKYEDLLPVGYENTSHATADSLLALLEEAGVPYLDLREEMQAEGISVTDAFYSTDHHWKPQTGLWAFGKILEKLEKTGAIASVDPTYTDPGNYIFDIHENTFLGSSGKRTGIYYAGLDDSIFLRPDFETDITIRIPERELEIRGRYEDVAYNTEAFHNFENPNYYMENSYGLYGWGDTKITHWRSATAPESGRVLMIGESFGNIPFSLLGTYFASCDELDTRSYDGDFAAYYASYAPDTVILEVNVDMVISDITTFPYPG